MKMLSDETVIGENVIRRKCHWMRKFLDECSNWMKLRLDESVQIG